MKTSLLLVCASVMAGGLVSCTGDLYRRTVPARTTATSAKVAPPAFGSPAYVNSLRPYGRPFERSGFYPYSESHPGGMGYYDRVASPHGSYEYLYHDLEAPHPAPGTPLKERTVRYTSRYPSSWGSPMWVTTLKPAMFARGAQGNAAVTTTTTTTTTTSRTTALGAGSE